MADFIPVISTSDVPIGTKKQVTVKGKHIMIVNVDGTYFAVDDRCTHMGCPLAAKGSIQGKTIVCGCHNGTFDLTTGKVLAPPPTIPLAIYRVSVEGDMVLLEV